MTGEKQYISEYQQGLRLCLSNTRRNEFSPLCRIKSLNYLETILEREQAIRQGYDEAVILNTQNHVCEGTISNLFWLKDHQLYTPNLACGLLPGIWREKMIAELAAAEIPITQTQLQHAEKIMIGNSLRGGAEAKIH